MFQSYQRALQAMLGVMLLASTNLLWGRPDAEVGTLLDRFRHINWDQRAVGKDKDLSDEAWKTRIEVENKLIALGKQAVRPLIAACGDGNPHVRTLAAYCLGHLNDRGAVPALLEIASEDRSAPARLMAVEAMGRLGAGEATATIEAAAKNDASPHVRAAAQAALPRCQRGQGVGETLREMAVRLYDPKRVDSAVVGKPAPDFALPDASGKTVRLADFRGKKNIIIVFLLADW